MPSALASALTLVTTAEFLADPMPADLEKAYDGHEFLFLGPLLDKPGDYGSKVLIFSRKLLGTKGIPTTRKDTRKGLLALPVGTRKLLLSFPFFSFLFMFQTM